MLAYTTTSYGGITGATLIGGDNVADALVVTVANSDVGVILSHTGDGNTSPNTPGSFNSALDWDSATQGDQYLQARPSTQLSINLGGGTGVVHSVTLGSIASPASTLGGTFFAINNASTVSGASLNILDNGSAGPGIYFLDTGPRLAGKITGPGFRVNETGTPFNGGVRLQGSGGANTFNVSNTTPGQTQTVVGGPVADSFNVDATAVNSSLVLDGNGGNDLVSIPGASAPTPSVAQSILGPVSVVNNGGSTNLTVDNSADTTPRNVTVSATAITGLAPATISYDPAILTSLNLSGGGGGNTFTILDTPSNPRSVATALTTGSGLDTVSIQAVSTGTPGSPLALVNTGNATVNIGNAGNAQRILGPVGLSSNKGRANLTVDDSTDPTGRSATLGAIQGFPGQSTPRLTGLTPQPISFGSPALSALTVNTGGGGNTLTVDFNNGNPLPVPPPGFVFNGGTGGDTLTLQGGQGFRNETMRASGPGAGTINLDNSSIGFTGLKPINDVTPALSFSFFAPGGPQSLAILDGPAIKQLTTDQIRSTASPAGFELVNLANKANVFVSAPGGRNTRDNQTVVIDAPTAATGLSTLAVSTGPGDDAINLQADPAGVGTSISPGVGTNTIAVASAGVTNNGSTAVNGTASTNAMTYDANGNVVTVSSASVSTGSGNALLATVTFGGLSQLRIINSPDPPLSTSPRTISADLGTAFSGATVASFTDTDPNGKLGDYAASINWGDGTTTPADSIASDGSGGFNVLGSHTYAAAGTFPVVATINDRGSSYVLQNSDFGPFTVFLPGGATATTRSTAVVNGPTGITVTGLPVSAIEGRPFSGHVATFVPQIARITVPLTFKATIDWGDNTPATAGTVSQPGGPGTPYIVDGVHTYGKFGTHTGHVTVQYSSSIVGAADFAVTVAPDLTVYNTADVGTDNVDGTTLGSLRHALLEVELGLGSDVPFEIPGAGPHIISLNHTLPDITHNVTLDATSMQPGYTGHPVVVVSGAGLSGNANNGLVLAPGSEKSRIQGLVIHGFSNVAIFVENAGGNTIRDDYIGTNASGDAAVPNFQGVLILGSSDNLIGGPGHGNLISGNRSAGIQILDSQTVNDPTVTIAQVGPASNNRVLGNRIGTNAAGTGALGNQQGIFINDAPSNTIGGAAAGEGNIISGNKSTAVQVLGPNAAATVILGNRIGTDPAGGAALGNGSGVFLFASASNMSMSDITGGNTIQNNSSFGVRVRPLTDGPTVESAVANAAAGGGYNQLTLTFTMYLDRTRAGSASNYNVTMIGPGGRLSDVGVASAVYNGIDRSVVLQLRKTIPAGATFELRVIGRQPGGLTDTSGNALDGNETAGRISTGSDNVTVFRRGQASQPGAALARKLHPKGPKQPHRFHPGGHGHRKPH